ncbi:MAG: hypothetical protein DMG06_01200 [Acidobacteria bacterium]|nr:MAG: hypothetical protein DMG06_01200 [Acidobacteriota bacterium]
MSRVIGIDFDNTLICYDSVFHSLAVRGHLISPATPSQKTAIRDIVRNSPEGDLSWQQLQALAYGPAIAGATLFHGVLAFFQECKKNDLPVFIVSHKTQVAWHEQQPVQLWECAWHWMREHDFFNSNGLGLSPDHIFFESTRADKIQRIRVLGCTHFIDDLYEVFAEPDFPVHVTKLLFAPNGTGAGDANSFVFESWLEIKKWFFG